MIKKLLHLIWIVAILAGCASPAGQAQVAAGLPAISTSVVSAPAHPENADAAQMTTEPAAGAGSFILTSPEIKEGGMLPVEYTCDGTSLTLPLTWNGAPSGTKSYAVIMHHVAGPQDIHWYWVLYNIPADVTSLPENVSGIGTLGSNSVNSKTAYTPPCSKGPGAKVYTYTVYALSTMPQLALPADQVNRAALLAAIQGITLASAELHVTYSRPPDQAVAGEAGQSASKQAPAPDGQGQSLAPQGGTPPQAAIAACASRVAQAACQFISQKGTETGVCELVASQLACSPQRGPAMSSPAAGDQTKGQPDSAQHAAAGTAYNIEQAISDKAQGMTISFDALAFLTGDLGSDSFFPPGKVADFWGFQYLRDNDSSQMGHAGDFLTSAAMNVLNTLTQAQRMELVTLAKGQVEAINTYGYKRFVLMKAFRRLAEGDLPAGATGLSEAAVKAYSAELYQLDGEISFARARVMGSLIQSLDASQKAALDAMVGKGMLTWPNVEEPADVRSLDRDVKVAVMTYAADLYSWYAGSTDADVYFCPERHGTYFGSFYLKDMPAMSNSSYAIPTNLTGDMGEALLGILTPEQAELITSLVAVQKPYLQGIVNTRQAVSAELRKFKDGSTADSVRVAGLMDQYGQLDGEIVYNLAVNFAKVSQSLTEAQKIQLTTLREKMLGSLLHPSGAFLYSQTVPMPEIPNTDFLFQ